MANLITPLSRRPRWMLLMPLLSICLFLPVSVLNAANSPTPFPSFEWLWVLYPLALASIFYGSFTSLATTDYDPGYLYLFQKTGTKQIPLGSFYKLAATSNYWQLCYRDEQQRKQAIRLIPLGTSWFWPSDTSSIQGFISAVWKHNPDVDVHKSWFA